MKKTISIAVGLVVAVAVGFGLTRPTKPHISKVAPVQGSTPLLPVSLGFDKTFIWIGKASGPFTSEELKFMATNYKYIVIAKFHDHWNAGLPASPSSANPATNFDLADQLKQFNPEVKVLLYYNASKWFANNKFGGGEFSPAWILKDVAGQPVPFDPTPSDDVSNTEKAYFVDLTNSDYRKFAETIISGWLAISKYDGIAFDSAVPLGLGTDRQNWHARLGDEKLLAWNKGLYDLVDETRKLLPTKLILYNGISPVPIKVNRNLDLLQHTDMTLNEALCVAIRKTLYRSLPDDWKIMADAAKAKKIILEKVNYDPTLAPADLARLSRYCYGGFLLGYQPGYTYYKFGSSYNETPSYSEIHTNAKELTVDLGQPLGPYQQANQLYYRLFEKGVVYVNSDEIAHDLLLPRAMLAASSILGEETQYEQGASFGIPAHDAAFFLY